MQSQIHFLFRHRKFRFCVFCRYQKLIWDSDRHKHRSHLKFTHRGMSILIQSNVQNCSCIYLSWGYFSYCKCASNYFIILLYIFPPFFLIHFLQCTLTHPPSFLQLTACFCFPLQNKTAHIVIIIFFSHFLQALINPAWPPAPTSCTVDFGNVHLELLQLPGGLVHHRWPRDSMENVDRWVWLSPGRSITALSVSPMFSWSCPHSSVC